MTFIPGIYRLPAPEIARIQAELVREAVSRAARRSPFYKERLARARIRPSAIRSLAALAALPLTSREQLQRRPDAFLAVPRAEVAELVATSGTTGEAVFVPMTERDIERLAENERRGFSWIGARPGDRYHIAVTMDNLFVAGLAYHRGLQRLGATAIRVGAQPVRRHIELLRRLRPEGIVAVPSLLLAVAREADASGLALRTFAPPRAMLIGDSLRGRDLESNTLGRLVDAAWGDRSYSTYGLTEAGLAFHECPARRGLHAHPDLIAVEVVDESGAPVPGGETGELVITPLQVEAMPLLRYRTGDITFLVPGECPCGRGGPRIGPILGRTRQRLKVKGTTLYPRAIEDALLSVEGVRNFVIEARSAADGTDRVVVRVGTDRKETCFRNLVSDTLFSKLRVTPEVRLASPSALDKILFEGGRRKPRVFVDLRKTGEAQ